MLLPGVRVSAWKSLGGLGGASECLGEQVSLLVGELVGGEFVPWPSQTAFGWNRNPGNWEESKGIWRNLEKSGANTGIPVRQEFLQKIL